MNERLSTSTCPSCGAQATGKFCHECGASLSTGACAHCGASLVPGARFCQECGNSVAAVGKTAASVSGRAAMVPTPRPSGSASYAPWVIAVILMVAAVGYFAGRNMTEDPSGQMAAGGAPVAPFAGTGGGGAAPDISSMTPRERSGRLYDRVMRYVEEGKKDSAQFFAPMALASFETLGDELDLDARYDYGRVASETGSLDIAKAQSDTILQKNPTHLLGLALSARTAALRGDDAAASRAWKLFLSSKDAELKKNLPEYQAHASDIESATKIAQGAK